MTNQRSLASFDEWLQRAGTELSADSAYAAHVDRFLSHTSDKSVVFQKSLGLFHRLKQFATEHNWQVRVGLTISLISDSTMLRANSPSSLDDIYREMDFAPFEPPILYLLSRTLSQKPENIEEYRTPLLFLVSPLLNEQDISYYREFRDQQAMMNGWEFSRGIYIERYMY